MSELTFLGTGNFQAPPGRYWNSFVLDGTVLVEPSPTALPHLRRCGYAVDDIEVIVVSHFHADHCFGWPFLVQAAAEIGGGRTLHVVGPPGVEEHFARMCDAGAVGSMYESARAKLDLRFVEVDGTWQEVGRLRLRAIEVVHVPYLRCFGYLFERPGGRIVAYSGDTTLCPGLDELARESDVLVVECNGHVPHGEPPAHMEEASIRELQSRHPDLRLVLTHLGEQVDTSSMPGVTIPGDFERLSV